MACKTVHVKAHTVKAHRVKGRGMVKAHRVKAFSYKRCS